MEKFTKWADKGTGVNPFLPLRPPATKGIVAKLGTLVISLLLLTIRLPFVLLTTTWLLLVSLLTTPLVDAALGIALIGHDFVLNKKDATAAVAAAFPSTTQQQAGLAFLALGLLTTLLKPLHRLVSVLFLRTTISFLTAIMGISFLEQHANLRKLGLRPPGYKPPTKRVGAEVKGGDLMLSNHTSILEVLYFASRFLPLFASFSLAPEVSFGPLSFVGALWRASHVPPKGEGLLEKSKKTSLEDMVTQAKGQRRPLVVFPEMVRSNGEGVLLFPKGVLDGSGSVGGAGVHVFAFSALKGDQLTSHTVGHAAFFLLKLLCTWRTIVQVTYVGASDVPSHPSSRGNTGGKSTTTSSSSSSTTPAQWSEEIRTLLATMLGRPKLNLGYQDFVTFGLYYKAINKGDDALAATLASAREKM